MDIRPASVFRRSTALALPGPRPLGLADAGWLGAGLLAIGLFALGSSGCGKTTLLYALAHCIIRDGRIDPESIANTEGYDEFARFVRDYSPAAVAEKTGLDVETIETLARTVSDPDKRVSWWWTMGVNQSYEGVRTAQATLRFSRSVAERAVTPPSWCASVTGCTASM